MDSKSPTNWIDLPMEMRAECVKWLDFKSRMCLRATSHTEKSLVESAPKIFFDNVTIQWDADCWGVICPKVICYDCLGRKIVGFDQSSEHLQFSFEDKCYQLMLQVFKFANVGYMQLHSKLVDYDDADQLISDISSGAPFRFNHLYLMTDDSEAAQFLLRNSKFEHLVLKRLTLNQQIFLQDFKDVSCVANACSLNFGDHWQRPGDLFMLIEKWIENDAKTGKLECTVIDEAFPEAFEDKFKDRIIKKIYESDNIEGTTYKTLIRTDNASKHISVDFFTGMGYTYYIWCKIIDA